MTQGVASQDSSRDYSTVTEVTGEQVRRDAFEKMNARYAFAAERAAGKDVLEVACGSGQGLGLLARTARRVVGGDVTDALVQNAMRHYGDRVDVVKFDAQALPFEDASFDLLLCYEALYYFADADRFCTEAARVLRTGGELLIVSVNPEWNGFNPSPYSTHYHTTREFRELLSRHGFDADVRGAFPDAGGGAISRLIGIVRRVAVSLHLVPTTMRAKRVLKRLFYGRLVSLPPELSPTDSALPRLAQLGSELTVDTSTYTVLYAIGARRVS